MIINHIIMAVMKMEITFILWIGLIHCSIQEKGIIIVIIIIIVRVIIIVINITNIVIIILITNLLLQERRVIDKSIPGPESLGKLASQDTSMSIIIIIMIIAKISSPAVLVTQVVSNGWLALFSLFVCLFVVSMVTSPFISIGAQGGWRQGKVRQWRWIRRWTSWGGFPSPRKVRD